MSLEAVLSAIIGLLVLVLGSMARVMWNHASDCRDFRVKLAEDQGRVHEKLDRFARDMGDTDTGLRGSVHKLRGEIGPLIMWAEGEIERRQRGQR